MFLTYKYVLLPTKRQHKELSTICEEQRQLYNGALWARNWAYERTTRGLTLYDHYKELTEWRQSDQDANGFPANLQRWTLRRLDNAFKAFLKRAKNKTDKWGKPRYRSPERWHSFGFSEFVGIALNKNRIKFKGLSSSIKIHFHRQLPKDSEIKSCVFTKIANHWYVALQVKVDAPEKVSGIEKAIGVDVGLNNFIFGSDGSNVPNPRFSRKAERKIAECNRRLARCKKKSNRRKKVKLQLTKAHLAVKNARKTFLHQWSRALVDKYDLICHEDLKIVNMAKSNMAKSIYDAGWATFFRYIAYKAEGAGKYVRVVDSRFTSQECPGCGMIRRKSLADRIHNCQSCGLEMDRDHAAAKVILSRGVVVPGLVAENIGLGSN